MDNGQRRRRRTWHALLGALAAAGLAAGIALGMGAHPAAPARPHLSALATNPDLDPGTPLGGRPAPGFQLTNQFGQRARLSQWRGKVVVLAFVDDQCTTICPLTTMSMLDALHLLGPAAAGVQLVGVVANPRALSVADVASFSRAHGLEAAWQFLTGSARQVRRVWHAYGIYAAVVHGQVDHTPAIYVLNRQGREEALFETQLAYASVGQQAQILARAIARWLPQHPRVPTRLSYKYLGGVSPATPELLATATATGPGAPILLGPGQPHLLVFFASWLTQTTALAPRLLALNAYAAEAAAHKWPALTAVDEAPTEPSPQALGRLLGSLGHPLGYPVAVDASGRLADGYGVAGLPWLVLTSATGRVLWHHAGFLTAAQLAAQVARYAPRGAG